MRAPQLRPNPAVSSGGARRMSVGQQNRRRERPWRRLGAAAALAGAAIALVAVSSALAGSRGPGALDRQFGNGGTLVVNRTHNGASAVDIGRKGRIVVAGGNTIARRRPNGHPDRSFGKRGLVRLDSGPYASPYSFVSGGSSSVAIGAKGAVFAAGATCSESGLSCDFAVSRLTPDGALDRSFGQGGTARIGFRRPLSEALSIATGAGGHLFVGGTTCNQVDCLFALAELDRNGDLDPSFGNGGRVTGSFGTHCYDGLGTTALDSRDRTVVVASCRNGTVSLARFQPNGKPDRSFGGDGRVNRDADVRGVDALATDSHSRIVLAGVRRKRFGIVRFERGGKLDSSFGHHGLAIVDFRHSDHDTPTSVALDSHGRIAVGGGARGFAFARLKPGGRLDRRFGNGGTRRIGFGQGFQGTTSVAIDGRDRIVGVGTHQRHRNAHFALMRLLG